MIARAAASVDDLGIRHALLAAVVAGLLAGPRWPAVVLVLLLAGGVAAAVAPPALRLPALGLVAGVLAGAAIADARLAALERTALGPLLGKEVEVRATVLEPPRTALGGTRVLPVRLLDGRGRGERVVVRVPAQVEIGRPAERLANPPAVGRQDRQPSVALGAVLRVRGSLRALGPFDAYERRRHAHAVLTAERVAATGADRGGLLGALDVIRRRAERGLTSGLPAGQGALARGMVLGQDDALDPALREDFRTTGLAHLVAASGANVMLLVALVLAVCAVLGLGLSARLVLAALAIVAYVPLAGGGPSIQRAGVMGCAALVALMAGRPSSRWYALLLAAASTLALDPRAAEDPGWQLSFAAVCGLLGVAPAAVARLRRAGVPPGLAEALAVTLVATLATAPLTAMHFGRLSLVSLPANVLAAPAVAPVMWLGTIAGALAQISPALAAPVSGLAALPLAYLTWLAERAATVPWAEEQVALPPAAAVALYALLVAASVWWRLRAGRAADAEDEAVAALREPRRRRRARARLVAAGAVLTVLAVPVAGRPRAPAELTVSFLDVGQGDATLIQHGSRAVLVDAGRPDAPILRRLREAGVRDLDMLVLTHASADHDGGAAAVLSRHRVDLVLDGGEATGRTPGLRAATATAVRGGSRRLASDRGQVIRAGPIELRVLWPRRDPPAEPGADPNLRATVLHVRDGDFDLLLSADAESEVLSQLDLPRVDAMKVPHHGSADPGLPEQLRRLRPQAAVITTGPNTYGHPRPETVRALQAAVGLVRRTDRDGTVRLTWRGGRVHAAP